ncbi:MAG: ribose 5-phosphate isomerase B [Bacteroidetes bacterium]|nr:ribose 5-phosphate isomerase B [Bacteroidota bacterium]HET6245328.1 ribose 5-phosphate isomerase B [Bacteroidia bacterium]
MQELKLALGADHAGYKLKELIVSYLKEKNYLIKDFGTNSESSVDYPDFAHPVAQGVQDGNYNFGILICGSANGINMTANKYRKIRSALCWKSEIAELARLHNDANILALPARYISEEEAIKTVDVFLNTAFEGGRHQKRVEKINQLC